MNERPVENGDRHARVALPTGDAVVIWSPSAFPKIKAILLPGHAAEEAAQATKPGRTLPPLVTALRDYAAGEPVRFSLDDLDFADSSPFSIAVSEACARIPRGEVRSYSDLAEMAGKRGAARAAGGVMARNRFPLVVPCHRVVASGGHLHQFGGGLPLKRALLELEGCRVDDRDHVTR